MCHVAHSMKKVSNQKRLQGYLKKYHEYSFLKKYPLHLYQCNPNEILNQKLNPKQFLLFLVEGTCEIINTTSDGRLYQITRISTFTCFGDMEFAYDALQQHEIKTVTECEFIAIDLEENREKILKDPKLLYFLLQSVTIKTSAISNAQAETTNVESRILYYLNEHQQIKGVNLLCNAINASRRQVQRALAKLCNEQMIRKVKKGVYERIKSNDM